MPIPTGIAMGVAKRFDLLMVIEIFKFEATNHFAPISFHRACKNSHFFNRLKLFDILRVFERIFSQPVERCKICLGIMIPMIFHRQHGTGLSPSCMRVIKNFLTYVFSVVRVIFIIAHIPNPPCTPGTGHFISI